MEVTKGNILSGDIDQLRSLLRVHFAADGNDPVEDLDVDRRLAIAGAVLLSSQASGQTGSLDWQDLTADSLVASLEKKFPGLPAMFKAELQFVFRLLEGYVVFSHLDEKLNTHLEKLRTILLAHSIADPRFWIRPHPMKLIVDFLYEQMVGWQEGFGKNSEDLEQLFVDAVKRISAIRLLDVASCVELHVALIEEFGKKMRNFDKLANRLKDSETGILKARMSQFVVIDFINKSTHGNQLPPVVSDFLLKKFADEMKLVLLKQGLDSPLWLRWKKLIETMIRLYRQGPADPADATGKKLLQQLPDEITAVAGETFHDNSMEDCVNRIAFDFAQLMLGKPVDGLSDCKPIELPGMVVGIDKKTSKELINRVKHIKEGQWFLYKEEKTGESKRCRLLLSLPDYDQLLFANFVGQKVLAASFEDFAYLLSSKRARPIFQASISDRVISLILGKLLENYRELQEAMESAVKKKELEIKRQAEKNREVEAEKQRQSAAIKAQAEAEALKARNAAEARAEAERQSAETARRSAETEKQLAKTKRESAEEEAKIMERLSGDMKRQARLMIDSLALGSWVEKLNPETKNYSRIKLAVKFNATGRFVFVDADGINVADLNRDDLVEMVLLKKIKLLDSDARFADRLAKIVSAMRTD